MVQFEDYEEFADMNQQLINQIDMALEAADELEAVIYGPLSYQEAINNNLYVESSG